MAKGLRSKIKKRWRKLRRDHIDEIIGKEQHNRIVETLKAVAVGQEYRPKDKPNAFLHPDAPDAVFPQVKPAPIIDLRSTSIPGSGREWSGANRKHKTVTTEVKTNTVLE